MDDLTRMMANPFYAIEIDPTLAEPHPTLVDRETWISANARTISEIGAEAFLDLLLDVLEGNYVTAAV